MLFPTLLALHVAPLLTRPTLPARPQEESQRLEEVAEDVEILRRLLVQALEPERSGTLFDPDTGALSLMGLTASQSVVTYYAGSQRAGRSRGFRVPGNGVFYSFDLELPVALEQEAASREGSTAAQDDDWERTRREVRGGTSEDTRAVYQIYFDAALRAGSQGRWGIDPKAREEAVDAVLRILAKHGSRLRGIAPGETIVVALFIEGSSGASPRLTRTGRAQEQTAKDGTSALTNLLAQQAPPEHLVIQVPFDALRGSTNGAGLEELRRRASIDRY